MARPTDAGRVRRERKRRGARQDALPQDRKLGELTPAKLTLVAELPRAQREALTLSFLGHSPAEIADLLHRSRRAVYMELHRGRKRVLARLAELGEAGALVFAAVTHWLRRRSDRAASLLAPDALSQTIVATAVIPLLTSLVVPLLPGTTAITRTSPPVARPGLVAAPTAFTRWPNDGAGHSTLLPAPGGSSSGNLTPAPRPRSPAPIQPPAFIAGHTPSDATPEQTTFIAAAAAPDYSTSRGVVALGMSSACACWTLFESLDGGATWKPSAAAAPPSAEQIALPPRWPQDPRIFIGTDPVTGVAAYVVPQFGALPEPLPGPPGNVSLSARFDHGDDRALIAAQGQVAVVTLGNAATITAPLITYPTSVGVASVATPSATTGDDALILAPPGSEVVAAPLAGRTASRSLMRCRGTACSWTADAPPSAVQIAAQPAGPQTAVSWSQGFALSPTGGAPFRAAPLPARTTAVDSVAVQGTTAWAVITRDGGSAVLSMDTAGGSPPGLATGTAALSRSVVLVPLGATGVLDLLAGGGLLCTADHGTTWHARC